MSDIKAALQALAGATVERPVRKLSFYEQCAAFCALYNRISPAVVAKAFAISPGAASQLGGCLKTDPRPQTVMGAGEPLPLRKIRPRRADRIGRYGRVAAEFERLGEEAFQEKYFSDAMLVRIREAQAGLAPVPRRTGPDPHANDYCFANIGAVDPGEGLPWRIEWKTYDVTNYVEHPPATGWWVVLDPPIPGHIDHFGQEFLEGGSNPRPFRRSQDAFDGIYAVAGQPSPRK